MANVLYTLESMNSLLYPVRVYCMYVLMSYTPFIYRIILCDYSNNKHSVFSVTECWNEYTPVISSYSYHIAFSSIFTRDGRKLNWVCFGYSLRIICFTVYYVPQCIVFAPVISHYILQWRIETLYIMIVSWMRYRIYPRYIYIHTLEFNIMCMTKVHGRYKYSMPITILRGIFVLQKYIHCSGNNKTLTL